MKSLTFGALALLFVSGSLVAIGQQRGREDHQSHGRTVTQTSPSMAQCKQLMADRQSMRVQWNNIDDKLDHLVDVIDRRRGDDKLTAVADLAKELVKQHRSAHDSSAKMDDRMMTHMMQHMGSGGMMMSNCPMMAANRN